VSSVRAFNEDSRDGIVSGLWRWVGKGER